MSYKAAVLDDNPSVLDSVVPFIKKGFENHSLSVQVTRFGTVRALETSASLEAFDVFFLDISMPEGDGVKFASSLRSRGNRAIIIFISGVDDRVFEAIRVQPLRFVRKRYLLY